MTLSADAERNRIALIAQLYDDWRGYYVLRRIEGGVYVDVRRLSRDEALTYRCNAGEALEAVQPGRKIAG